jgi:hypothetical protein
MSDHDDDSVVIPPSTDDDPGLQPRPLPTPRGTRSMEARSATRRTAADATQNPTQARNAAHPREPFLPEAEMEMLGPRVPRHQQQVDLTDLPAAYKKPGRDYQWLPIRVLNEPVDPSKLHVFRDYGRWAPEKARDWPTMVDEGTPPDAPVERQALRLYGRPMAYTLEAKEEDVRYANEQHAARMQASAAGKSIRRNEGDLGNGLVKIAQSSIDVQGVVTGR